MPDTVPRAVTIVRVSAVVSVIVNVPENDESDCVISHVIWPGPDASDADPLQEPLTLDAAVEDVALG